MRFPHAVDPMTTEDEQDRLNRAAEAQRWEDEAMLKARFYRELPTAATAAATAFSADLPIEWPDDSLEWRCAQHAADYGWPAVFRILADAIYAHDDAINRR